MPFGFTWNEEKGRELRERRKVSFEDVATVLHAGDEIDNYDHPNQRKYPQQRIYVVEIRGYLYMVPYVTQDDGTLFLKTIFPSSRAMRRYGRRRTP